MTTIEVLSSDILTITYRRNLSGIIIYLSAGLLFLALAVLILVRGGSETPTGEYAAFATPFLILVEIGSLIAAFFFLSPVFDVASYSFNKTEDKFCVKGRKYLFKYWKTEGMVSEIIGVSYEIFGVDENTSSEIYLKFRCYGNVIETLKCGTGEVSEDDNIADTIERFLKEDNKK